MVKRILGVSLAATMALSSAVPAFAVTPADGQLAATGIYADSIGSVVADKDAVDINGVVGKDTTQGKYSQYDVVLDGYTGTTMNDTTSETEVYATVLPMFMTRIPKVLVLSAAGECEFAVSVKGDISGAQTVLIKPEAEQFDMVEVDPLTGNPIGKKDNVPATITVDDIDWTYATDFKTVDSATYVDHTGSILADGLTAGSWRGVFNFLIGLNILGGGSTPAPDDSDPVTYYTMDEIEADPTLFMIGATRPEYVVADFNDDFTEVVITKNGESSDGIMAALMDMDTYEITSPMSLHASTLINAVVKEGVVNIGVAAFFNEDSLVIPSYDNFLNPTLTVSLPDTIQSIDAYAFSCSNLKSIDIQEGLTIIDDEAFSYSSIKNIDLPESLVYIGENAFFTSNLREITIPSNVTSLSYSAFGSCLFLESADLGNVTDLDWEVFKSCYSLKEINCLPSTREFIESGENNVIYHSYLDYTNRGYEVTKEIFPDGSFIFYIDDFLPVGYIQAGSEIYIRSDINRIYSLYCEENVKLHVPDNAEFRNCRDLEISSQWDTLDYMGIVEMYVWDNITCMNEGFYPEAVNLTIYGATGSNAEAVANEHSHTFIAE